MNIRLFTGYDARESIGHSVFMHSLMKHASKQISITPLQDLSKNDGSNQFTYIRYMIPAMCDYQGFAIFLDGCDMLMLGDLAELWAYRDDRYAVQVIKHDYRSIHGTKYRGTPMESPNFMYPRKNWSSAMIINCAAPEWKLMEQADNRINKHRFQMFDDARIGALPPQWNVLIDENQSFHDAKILHWTAGIPAFDYYANAPMAELWHNELAEILG